MARTSPTETSCSFEHIYAHYYTPIRNYMHHLVGDRDQAEDLTQDIFLKAYRALPKMDASLNVSAWLYRIATNTAYDAFRRRRTIAQCTSQALDYEPSDLEGVDPQEIYVKTELVHAALQQMPQRYRAALLLYSQEGFSYREIAQALHIAEGGVKMFLFRARRSFQKHYLALEATSSL
jgi:RNA polymerase sigma-70 factor, ECF subfamily